MECVELALKCVCAGMGDLDGVARVQMGAHRRLPTEEEEASGASSARDQEKRSQVMLLHFALASSGVRSSWIDLQVEGLIN
jgi:hypothetical protein